MFLAWRPLLQNHLSMSNAGFIENRTDAAEPRGFIEFDNGDLRVKIDFLRALLLCRRNGAGQQFLADLFSSVSFEDGHAADFGLATTHHYPSRAHRPSLKKGQQVKGSFIVVVQLNVCGHALLPDKYPDANSQGLLQLLISRDFFDDDSWFHCAAHGIKIDCRAAIRLRRHNV